MAVTKDVMLGKTLRKSFAKHDDVLAIPNMLKIQKDSYEWFLREGLREVFKDVATITDYTGNLELSFLDYSMNEPPKYTVEECKERDATYAKPIKVRVRLHNKETDEIKEQEIFMGDFPLMTNGGTFVINGAERVIVSQIVRSPGVYFGDEVDKTDQHIYSATVIPYRGAWLEYETDFNNVFWVRIDKNRKLPITCLIRALGVATDGQITEMFGEDPLIKATMDKDPCKTREESLLEIYRRLRPGEPPTVESSESYLEALFFDARRYDVSKVGRYKFNKKLDIWSRLNGQTLAQPVTDPMTGEIIAMNGETINRAKAHEISSRGVSRAVIDVNGREVVVFSNGMVDMAKFVDFDPAQYGIKEKVCFNTLKEMLEQYLKFQFEVITRRTAYDLKKAKEREHILEGLKLVVDKTDEVIYIIRHSKDQNDSKLNLMERFGVTDLQAAAIVAMRLGQLSGMERIKIEDELAGILEKVKNLEEILRTPSMIYDIIRTELTSIRDKFGDDRRTAIETVSGEVDIEDLIPEQQSVITLTHGGYIKRQPVEVYRTQRRGGRGISGVARKDEDFVEDMFITSTHDYVLFFTNRGKMYRMKGYEIPETGRAARGSHVVNLLPIEKDEKISAMIRVDEVENDSYLVMVTRNGTIKRTALSAYRNVRKGGIIAINLEEGDELAWVRNTTGEDDLIIATRQGVAIRFAESDVRPMGRTATGVRAIRLDEGDEVIAMATCEEGGYLLTVTENGQGRRTALGEYRTQNRGGRGVRNYDCEGKGTLVAGVRVVVEEDDVILIADDGIIIRIPCEQIAVQSRYGGGVHAMRLEEGSRVVALARAPREEDAEEADGEETAEPQEASDENVTETPAEE